MEGNLDAAIESLLNVEKQCRLAGDVAGTKKASVDIVELCFKDAAWKTLNDQIVVLSKRRGQLKQAITAVVQKAMEYIDVTPDVDTRIELIKTLSSVAAGKIYVEIERARLPQLSLSSPPRVCPSFLSPSLSPPRALPHSPPIRLMEALAGAAAAASSALLPSFPAHQSHSRVALRARPCGPLRAASAGGGGGKDDAAKPNGTPVVKSKVDPSQNGALGPVTTEKSRTTSSTNTTPDSSGSRAGLFRTPISGGVQSATFAHGLPPPALAVRNLMEQARFAHLCTVMSGMHHRRAGYPFGSLVDFANDSMGHPIFSLSPLAIHTRNLLSDPRCTLVVQVPGWSGLSNARVTIFGDVYPLPAEQQEWAHKQYVAKHQQWASQQWGNFYYYRMQNISDIYFIGGFGTVAWVDVKQYETIQPDKIAVDGGEQSLKELNAIFSKPLREFMSAEGEVDDAALISVDSKGIDIRVRQGAQFNIQRLAFDVPYKVETLEEAKRALHKIIKTSSK